MSKRKKWVRVAWISAASLAVIVGGAYVAMNVAVDYALKQVASGFDAEELDKLLAGVGAESTDSSLETPEPGSTGSSETGVGKVSNDSNIGNDSVDATVTETPAPASDDGDAKGKPVAAAPEATPEPVVQVDTSLVAELQEKVTPKEKATVAAVLLKHFSANELKSYAAVASDGLTKAEKQAARDDFLQRLSEEEYNRLIKIAAKYGLSQGKTYKEVKKKEGA